MPEKTEEKIPRSAPFDEAGQQVAAAPGDDFLNVLAVELKNWGYTSYQSTEKVRRHGPYNEIQLILEGKSVVNTGGKEYLLTAPSMHLFSLGRETEITNLPGLKKVHFQCMLMYKSVDLLLGEAPWSYSGFPESPLSWWRRAKAAVDRGNLLAGKGLLYELLSHVAVPLTTLAESKKENLDYYDRFFQYIKVTRLGDFSLGKIAAGYGVHRNHFSQAFKRSFGMPAKQYYLGEKIREAKERLTESEENLADIAQTLGFYDAFHFSKAFKHHAGVSPRVFRNRYRSGGAS